MLEEVCTNERKCISSANILQQNGPKLANKNQNRYDDDETILMHIYSNSVLSLNMFKCSSICGMRAFVSMERWQRLENGDGQSVVCALVSIYDATGM